MKKNILTLLLFLTAVAASAQYNNRRIDYDYEEMGSFLKFGTQIPFQHSIIYDHKITPAFSLNAGFGLIAAPYPGMILSTLEGRNVISQNDKEIIKRSWQNGITYQVGANVHFTNNYVRLFGQMAHLNADLAVTDLANLYLDTNLPAITGFLNPIDIRSNAPMIGLLYGRRFTFPSSPHEIHIEGSISKTLGHNTTYRTGTFIDNFDVINDLIYNEVDDDLDKYFNDYGWIPSINVYYVYRFQQR